RDEELAGLRIERERAPGAAAACFPGVALPRVDAKLRALRNCVELPVNRASRRVECKDAPVYAELTAGDADEYFSVPHDRRRADAFAGGGVCAFHAPELAPGRRVERNHTAVTGAAEEAAIGERDASISRACGRFVGRGVNRLPLDAAVDRIQRNRRVARG